jgi:hypothetical protein
MKEVEKLVDQSFPAGAAHEDHPGSGVRLLMTVRTTQVL